MKSDSSEEFEDAVDTLAPLPSTPASRPNDFTTVTPRISSTSATQSEFQSLFTKTGVNPFLNDRLLEF